MSALRSWLRGAPSSGTSSKASSLPATPKDGSFPSSETPDIEDAMVAASLIMNDDIDGAEARLSLRSKDSTFHALGMGVAIFMRSVLGFEKEIMTEAASRLSDTEGRAWADMKRAQKAAVGNGAGAGPGGGSRIYPAGTEFALVHAEAQLMSAVVSVMQESLTEGVRGFYKLRKAFLTLNGIMESEGEYLRGLGGGTVKEDEKKEEKMPGAFEEEEEFTTPDEGDADKLEMVREKQKEGTSESEDDFVDAVSGAHTPASGENGSATNAIDKRLNDLNLTNDSEPLSDPTSPTTALLTLPLPSGTDSSLFTSSVDIFIHSGANMCFGMLLLLISMVPPAFSRLLHVIGFKGDRERGVAMLWQSTKFANINGAVAGLSLLGYYNGLLGFADILPTERDVAELSTGEEIVGYPKERCRALLGQMRTRYPESPLWKLEEARVLANDKKLAEAVEMLRGNSTSKMRQVTALNNFELSLDAMFLMDWETMSSGFVRNVELNDWSHALYYYLAGSAELEMYRDVRGKDEEKARRHKKRAEELFRKAPTVAGRKKFMARQMPLEVFVMRKVQKWEERAKALGVELADAVAVSPAMEMAYIWNGTKRLTSGLAQKAGRLLAWERCTMGSEMLEKVLMEKDEVCVRDVSLAAVERQLGNIEGARECVRGWCSAERLAFKGPTRDDYALPAAHYEMAAAAWQEASSPEFWPTSEGAEAVDEFRKTKVEECRSWLDKVAKWETFVLDARVGMRVQAGLDTLRWLKERKGWA